MREIDQQPEAFRRFACGFYDELAYEASAGEIARMLLSGLTADERRDLRTYIVHLKATLTPGEIKGVLNRAAFNVKFSTKGAAELLRAAQEHLDAVG